MYFHHIFFFYNDTSTTEIYTLSHTTLFRSVMDQLSSKRRALLRFLRTRKHLNFKEESSSKKRTVRRFGKIRKRILDRKSTRLNSSHSQISYAVFCLKKKKKKKKKKKEK